MVRLIIAARAVAPPGASAKMPPGARLHRPTAPPCSAAPAGPKLSGASTSESKKTLMIVFISSSPAIGQGALVNESTVACHGYKTLWK